MIRTTRSLAVPLYLVAVLLIFNSMMDTLITIWPLQPGIPRWRLGALGQFGSAATTLILAFVIAYIASWVVEHPTVQRVISVILGIMGILLLAGAVMLVLDMLQLRVAVRPEVKRTYDLLSLQALIKLMTTSLVSLTMAYLIFRHVRALPKQVERPTGPVVVVGSRPGSKPSRDAFGEGREVIVPPAE